jgi:hypothetical protein
VELKLGMRVDLAQLQDLAPSLRLKILTQAVPIVARDKQLRNVLTSQAISELQDYKMALSRAKTGGEEDKW